ncbi:flagellar hook-associated protein FlgK [Thiohalorhabdus sp.]|uniref:flagellar hook-associated protein FlgK n=1 Tax=Thiohalorhabdus sp. TaxID=3094134 RepID=UPI002FC3A21C
MPINNSLQNAVTALTANQLRMATTSNNVANASTEGYSRQRLEAGFRPDNVQGDTRFGSGVDVGNVQRMVSDYLIRSEVDQAARLGGTELRAELAGRLDNMFSEADGTGIAGGMEQLFSAVNDLANNPTGSAERSQVLQSGEQLSTAFNQRDQRLQDLQLEIDRRVTDTVDGINRDLAEIADLNRRIQEAEAATDGEALRMRDERDLLTKEVAEKVGINYHETSEGSYNIQLQGGGHSLVQGAEHYELGRAGDNRSTGPSSGSSGFETFAGIQLEERTQVDLTADLQEGQGELGAMLTLRDDTVVDLRNRLDNMARSVVEEVNKVHSGGVGLNYQDAMVGSYSINDTGDPIADATNGLPSGDLFQSGDLELAVHNQSTDEIEMVTVAFNGDESLTDAQSKINTAVNGAATASPWLNNADLQANITSESHLELTTNSNVDFAVKEDSSNLFAATGINNFFTMKNGNQAAQQTGPFDAIRSAEGLPSATQSLDLSGEFEIDDGSTSGTVTVNPADSLADLESKINGLGLDLTASVNDKNQLRLQADPGVAASEINFEKDTAGVMDRLGLAEGNSAATEIALDPAVANSPKRVAAGQLTPRLDDQGNRQVDSDSDSIFELGISDNQTANEWADLRDAKLDISERPETPTLTFAEHYAGTVGTAGDEKATADNLQQHQRNVMDQINNQREQHSGVNIDEEMTDMLNFQRGYQAASKVISTADEMFASLLQSV